MISLSLQTAVDLRRLDLLETENITDQLTQVYNRRYLDRRLDTEVARSTRYALPLSVLLLDIDHFKRVNDTYGHQAGDLALSTLGGLLKTALRDLDVVARYGGEEFLLICVNTPADGAAIVAERLRQMVESQQVRVADGSGESRNISITISIGVACLSGGIDSKGKLVEAADRALYRAKEEGRNRVIIAPACSGVTGETNPGRSGVGFKWRLNVVAIDALPASSADYQGVTSRYSRCAMSCAQASGLQAISGKMPAASTAPAVASGGISNSHAVSRRSARGMCSSGQAAGSGFRQARQRIGRK